MRKVTREVGRFRARSKDGFETTIVVTQDFIRADSLDGPGETPGLKTAMTIDGRHCNYDDKDDSFKIVDPFHRGDPVLRKV